MASKSKGLARRAARLDAATRRRPRIDLWWIDPAGDEPFAGVIPAGGRVVWDRFISLRGMPYVNRRIARLAESDSDHGRIYASTNGELVGCCELAGTQRPRGCSETIMVFDRDRVGELEGGDAGARRASDAEWLAVRAAEEGSSGRA